MAAVPNPTRQIEVLVEQCSKLVPLVRWLVVGAFALGVWTATIQYRIMALESWKAERIKPIEDYYKEKEENARALAAIKQDLEWIKKELSK